MFRELAGKTYSYFLSRISPKRHKEYHELGFWKWKKEAETNLSNEHYEYFYTTHFGLEPGFYDGKRILDIGCGPRGSLEWAQMTLERVGLDPLAEKYLQLGAGKHSMKYVKAHSESIPFEDDYFDVVTSFNSLDHVEDLNKTISEITRVTKPAGLFLLVTDVNHDPTPCEPQDISWDVVESFSSRFEILAETHFERNAEGVYQSLTDATPYDHSDKTKRYGILSVKFRKMG
jgi:ubiquinone/menaquinone biosynthesis C-methylase UbiE